MKKLLGALFGLIVVTVALSCGGGGGGGSGSSSNTHSSGELLKAQFKPSNLYNVRAGDELAILELSASGFHEALPWTRLSGDVNEVVEATFIRNSKKSYSVVSKRNGVSYMRTLILGSDIESAIDTGVIDIGRMNSVTSYLTGLLEFEFQGARRAAKSKSREEEDEEKIIQFIKDNFNGVFTRMSDMSVESLQNARHQTSDIFHLRMNRINILTVFFKIVTTYQNDLSDAQRIAMNELYSSIFDELVGDTLRSKASSTTLPEFPDKANEGRTLVNDLVLKDRFFTGEGVLDSEQLRKIFWNPNSNELLFDIAVLTPMAGFEGTIIGSPKVGIEVVATGTYQKGGRTITETYSTTSDAQGNYSFKGMLPGDYEIVANRPAGKVNIFNPSKYKVSRLANNDRIVSVNFQSITLAEHVDGQSLQVNIVGGEEIISIKEVTANHLRDGSVQRDKILDGAVSSSKLDSNIDITNQLTVGDNLLVSGDFLLGSNITLSNNGTLNIPMIRVEDLQIVDSLTPSVNGVVDLGSNELRFRNVYLDGNVITRNGVFDNLTSVLTSSSNINVTGDANLTNLNVTSTVSLPASSITTAMIAPNSITGDKVSFSGNQVGDILVYNGTDWAVLSANAVGQILIGDGTTVQSRAISGDLGLSSAGVMTLVNSGVAAGQYGSGNVIPVLDVDTKGRLTAVSNQVIEITGDQLSVMGNTTGDMLMYDGSQWVRLASGNASGNILVGDGGNVVARTVTGDLSLSPLGVATLVNTGVGAGSYGTANTISLFTVDSKGRITSASNQLVSIQGDQFSVSGNVAGDMLMYDGTRWVRVASGNASGNVLVGDGTNVVARTLTGDLSISSTGVVTLSSSGVTSGAYGGGNSIPTLTVDAKGRVINASNSLITIEGQQLSISGNVAGDMLMYNGTSWVRVSSGNASGNVLIGDGTNVVARTISGDLTLSSTGVATLANTGVGSGVYGSGNVIPILTLDSKGRVTGATNMVVSVDSSGLSVSGNQAGDILMYNGTTWVRVGSGNASGNVLIGDGTNIVSRTVTGDLSVNGTGIATLSNTAVSAGQYGSGNEIASFTVDSKGRLISASNTVISISGDQFSVSGNTAGDMLVYDGTDWVRLGSGNASGNILIGDGSTVVARTITGDLTINSTGVTTLADTSVSSGSYGSGNLIPTFTVDSKGRITAASNTLVSISGDQFSVSGNTNGDMLTYDGTNWVRLGSGNASGNILVGDGTNVVARTITGDLSINGSGVATLSPSGVTSGTYGAGNIIPIITVDSKGRVTGTTNVIVSVDSSGLSVAGNTAGDILVHDGFSWTRVGSGNASGNMFVGDGSAIVSRTLTGEVTINGTGVTALSTTGVTASSYGSGNLIPTFTVDAKGRLTAASNTAISISGDQLSVTGNVAGDILMYNGTNWVRIGSGNASGNVLVGDGTNITSRTLTGDVTISSSGVTTLGTSGVTASSYGSGNLIPTFTVDAKGRLTAASNTAIAISADQFSVSGNVAGDILMYNGTNWVRIGSGNASGNVLVGDGTNITSRTLTGDVTISSTGVTTLGTSGVTASSYGSGNLIPTFTVDAKGRLTAASNTAIAISADQFSVSGNVAGDILMYNGTNWVRIGSGNASGNVLVGDGTNITSRTLTGDVTISNTGVTTLGTSGVTASSYGSGNVIPTFTVDAKGRLTAASNTAIAISADQFSVSGNVAGDILMYNGTNWVRIGSGNASGNVLVGDGTNITSRTLTGDVTISSSGVTTLGTSGVTASSYGSGNVIPTFTVDAKGRLTAASNTAISISADQFSVSGNVAGDILMYNGTNWVRIGSGNASGNVLVGDGTNITSRTLTGDVTISSSGVTTLATSGVTASSYGSGNVIPTFTVDAKGRLTAASNTAIAISADQFSVSGNVAGDILMYNGTNWVRIGSGNASGNVLVGDGTNITSRTLTGDVTISSSGVTTLGTSGVTASSYGSGNVIPTFTVDAKGRLTAASNTAISISADQFSVSGNVAGDILMYNGTNWVRIGSGNASGNVLVGDGTNITSRTLTGDVTISSSGVTTLGTSGVTASSYGSGNVIPTFTVDAKGRLTAASNTAIAISADQFSVSGNVAGDILMYNGTNWVRIGSGNASGNVLVGDGTNITSRTLTGDVTISSTGVTTLGTSGVTASSYGSGNVIPTFTVDAKGRLTAASNTAIAISADQFSVSGNVAGDILMYNGTNWVRIGSGNASGNVLVGDGTNITSRTLTGDVTISSSGVTTLGTSGVTASSYGSGNVIPTFTVDAKGRLTAASNTAISISADQFSVSGNVAGDILMYNGTNWVRIGSGNASGNVLVGDGTNITSRTLTGDVTISSSGVTTLGTSGVTASSYGSGNVIPTFTVDAKGRLTAASNTAIAISADQFSVSGNVAGDILMYNGTNWVRIGSGNASGNVLVGDGTNITSRTLTGDVTISSSGVTTLGTSGVTASSYGSGNVIPTFTVDAKGRLTAASNTAIAISADQFSVSGNVAGDILMYNGTNWVRIGSGNASGNVLVGDGTNITSRTLTGDVTISSSGVTTLGTSGVTASSYGSGNVIPTFTVDAKGRLTAASNTAIAISADQFSVSGNVAGDILMYNGTNWVRIGSGNASGNVLVGDGTNITSRTLTGDVTISSTGVTTLGTSGVTASSYGSGNVIPTFTVDAKGRLTAASNTAIAISADQFSVSGNVAGDILMYNGTNWVRIGSGNASGNVLVGDGTNITSRTLTGDVTISSTGVTTLGTSGVTASSYGSGNLIPTFTVDAKGRLTAASNTAIAISADQFSVSGNVAGDILMYNGTNWVRIGSGNASGNVLVGDGTNITSRTLTGDVTISSTGVTTLGTSGVTASSYGSGNVIPTFTVDAKGRLTAASNTAIAISADQFSVSGNVAGDILMYNGTNWVRIGSGNASGNVLVGDGTNITSRTLTGDVTISSTGVTTLGTSGVTASSYGSGNVIPTFTVDAKGRLTAASNTAIAISADQFSVSGNVAGDILMYNGTNWVRIGSGNASGNVLVGDGTNITSRTLTGDVTISSSGVTTLGTSGVTASSYGSGNVIPTFTVDAKGRLTAASNTAIAISADQFSVSGNVAGDILMYNGTNWVRIGSGNASGNVLVGDGTNITSRTLTGDVTISSTGVTTLGTSGVTASSYGSGNVIPTFTVDAKGRLTAASNTAIAISADQFSVSGNVAGDILMYNGTNWVRIGSGNASGNVLVGDGTNITSRTLTGDVTISSSGVTTLGTSGVTASSYGSGNVIPTFTVDAKGRLTAASNTAIAISADQFSVSGNVAGDILMYNGTNWVRIGSGNASGNVLVGDGTNITSRTLTGDVTISSTGVTTLGTSGVTASSYGSGNVIPTFTVDAKGRLTAASNTAIAISADQFSVSGNVAGDILMYNGTNWVRIGSGNASGNVLVGDGTNITSRTLTGDVTISSSGVTTLGTSGVTASSYGSGNVIPTFTVDAKGRLTAASNTAISISADQFSVSGNVAGDILMYNGTNWVRIGSGNASGNVLVGDGTNITSRTLTGDVTISSTGVTTLGTSGVTASSYGSGNVIPTFTVDAKGRLTAASNTAISISADQFSVSGNVAGDILMYNGTNWVRIGSGNASGNVLVGDGTNITSRTLTGDVTISSTGVTTLGTSGVTASSYGSGNVIPTFTVDAKGRLTAASNTAIAISADQFSVSGNVAGDILMYNGTNWVRIGSGNASGNVLVGDGTNITSRTLTGDVTISSTGVTTLGTSGVTASSYGSGNVIPTFTVDAKGRLTAASNTAIAISADQFSVSGNVAGDILMYNGTNWVRIGSGNASGNVLVGDGTNITSRTLTGDVTISSTGVTTLGTSGVTASSYGSGNVIPTFTVDAKGRLTAAADTAIAISADQFSVSGNVAGDILMYNGTNWVRIGSGNASGNVLVGDGTNITSRTLTGEVTINSTGVTALSTTGVTGAAYGSGNLIPTFTVDSKGRLTAAADTAISISADQFSVSGNVAGDILMYNGTNWVRIGSGNASGNVLVGDGTNITSRTLTGEVTINSTGVTALSTTGVTGAAYGSGNLIPTFTVDSKGRLTAAADTAISISADQFSVSGNVAGDILMYNGTNWVRIGSGNASGNVLVGDGTNITSRTLTGEVTINSTGVTALSTTGVTGAAYGSGNLIPTFTVDSKGRLTAAADTAISISADQFSVSGNVAGDILMYNGTNWVRIGSGNASGNVLVGDGTNITSRTLTGEVTINSTGVTALSTTGVTGAAYGSGNLIPTFTVDSKGRLTAAADTAISISADQFSVSGNVAGDILMYNGTNWVRIGSGNASGNVLVGDGTNITSRTLTGEVTINSTGVTALSTTGVTGAAYGSGNLIPTFTVDSKGRLTAAADTAISISADQFSVSGNVAGDILMYNGTNWVRIGSGNASGNVLVGDGTNITSRTLTGEVTINSTGVTALSTTGVTGAAYGSGNLIPTFTVDSKGRLTAAADTAIAISADQFSVSGNVAGDILMYNGTNWVRIGSGNASGNVLVGDGTNITSRTLTGDVTISSTGVTTLGTSGVTSGIWGGSTAIPVLTIDAKGRVTSASNTSIVAGVNTALSNISANSVSINTSLLTNGTATLDIGSASGNQFQDIYLSGNGVFGSNVEMSFLIMNELASSPTHNSGNGFLYVKSGNLFFKDDAGTESNITGGGLGAWTTAGSNIYRNTGNVGVGTTTPTTTFHLVGDFTINGNVLPSANVTNDLGSLSAAFRTVYSQDIIMISDRRFKENIKDLSYGLKEIKQLKPKTFTWKDRPESGVKVGLIAQEVKAIMPEMVKTGSDRQRSMGVSYVDFVPVLIKALQEQQEEIEGLKEQLKDLHSGKREE